MQNNSNITDGQILEALNIKYLKALNSYKSLALQLELARKEVNKCIVAVNVFSEEQIPLIESTNEQEIKPKENSNQRLTKSHQEIDYKEDGTIKEKIISVIKIYNRAVSKQEIADFIQNKEPDKSIDFIKNQLTSDLYNLCEAGILAKSKASGIKMKGYFYGNPNWLVSEGSWKKEHTPMGSEQTGLWE